MARRHKVAYRWVLTETQLGGPPGSPGLTYLTVAAGEEQTKRKAREAAERAKLPGMRVYSVEIYEVKKR